MLAPHLAAEADRHPRSTGSASSTSTTRSTPCPPLPGAHEALAAVRRHGGRVVVVTGKFARNAQRHVDHLAFDIDHLEGEVWGVGKADVLRSEGASVYVGDHVHDVEGALAAGVAQRLRADRGLAAARSCSRPAPTSCSTPSTSSPRGSTSTSSTCGWPRSRRGCASWARSWSPSAAAPTAPCCSPPPCAPWAPTTSSPPPATPTRCRRSSATRPGTSRPRSASSC